MPPPSPWGCSVAHVKHKDGLDPGAVPWFPAPALIPLADLAERPSELSHHKQGVGLGDRVCEAAHGQSPSFAGSEPITAPCGSLVTQDPGVTPNHYQRATSSQPAGPTASFLQPKL